MPVLFSVEPAMHQRCLLLLLLLPLAAVAATAALRVEHARVADAPPTASMRVAYLELHNDGDAAIRITGADSPDFARVEMHQTLIEDGVARMRALPYASVPAHGRFVFAAGGAHLMLIAPTRTLAVGDRVRIVLVCASGERVALDVPVGSRGRRTEDGGQRVGWR